MNALASQLRLMGVQLHLAVETYRCRECFETRGLEVRALARMIPACAVMDGEMVGTEYWCCPVCHRPKFDLKRKPFVARTRG